MLTRLPFKGLIIILALVPLLVLATPAAAEPGHGPMQAMVHTVRPGETLYSIARAYGVDVYQLAMANHLVNANLIYAGQRLVVPGGQAYAPPPYMPPQMPQHAGMVYVVRPGDTAYSIAARHGTTVWALAQANNLKNPNMIYAGQRLVIPGGQPGYGSPPPTQGHPDYGSPPPTHEHPPVKKGHMPKPLKPAVCNERTKITSPLEGETLDGLGTHYVTGTASIDDFQFYKLEYGFGAAPIDFFSIDEVQKKAVVNGILGSWNTGALPEGTFTLRLTVVDNRGQYPPPCDVLVRVDHPAGVDP